jgi:rhamnosyltransferase
MIAAVIVSYNPGNQLYQNVAALSSQVEKIIIVDNASANKHVFSPFQKPIEIIYNSHNVGLATALNQGVERALELNAQWILTFDQDSVSSTNFVQDLLKGYESCITKHKVALVGPIYKDQVSGVITSYGLSGREVIYKLTSGTLFRADILHIVGLFRDGFFIDYIDIEYCLRCKKLGYKVLESSEATLLHNLGQPSHHFILGRQFRTTNHSPLRRYYNARNRVIVYREYSRLEPHWVLKDCSSFSLEIIKMLLAEKQRGTKLRYIMRGIWHGLLKREGPYE